MAKVQSEIIAKRISCCPLCMSAINRGDKAKVYRNAWYHPHCADEVYQAVKQRQELRDSVNGDKNPPSQQQTFQEIIGGQK